MTMHQQQLLLNSRSLPETSPYADVGVLEEPEEENPTAYTLLTKIEDPYYVARQHNSTDSQTQSNEEDKSCIQVYKSFYSSYRPKAGSYDPLPEFVNPDKPLKKFLQKTFQEPKRHSSVNVPARNGTSSPLSTSAQNYIPKLHRDGVNTPPPGLNYYEDASFAQYNIYNAYDSNGYTQEFPQADMYSMPGYYPMYMNYPMFQNSPSTFQPQHKVSTPKKKSVKPSQFRPNISSFYSKDHTFGDHCAENEKDIIAIITDFEEKGNDLSALKGKITQLAITQTGSRFLQRQLTKSSPEFISFVLQEVEKTLPKLMVDNYANYFCQRLLGSCSQPQRTYFIQKIMGSIVEISKDKKGTHTVQSLLDVMTMTEEEELVASDLKDHVFEMANDLQATHVIQKALLTFADERKQFIIEEALEKLIELANTANGLCLIKKVIPICSKDTELVRRVVKAISDSAMELAQNPFGNYAIQVALDSFTTEQCTLMLSSFKGKYTQLSMLKFSSNAVEKCIEKAELQMRNEIIQEIISSDKFLTLMKNSFGNYVIQKILSISEGEMKVEVGTAIQNNISHLTDKKLKSKWTQILDKSG